MQFKGLANRVNAVDFVSEQQIVRGKNNLTIMSVSPEDDKTLRPVGKKCVRGIVGMLGQDAHAQENGIKVALCVRVNLGKTPTKSQVQANFLHLLDKIKSIKEHMETNFEQLMQVHNPAYYKELVKRNNKQVCVRVSSSTVDHHQLNKGTDDFFELTDKNKIKSNTKD